MHHDDSNAHLSMQGRNPPTILAPIPEPFNVWQIIGLLILCAVLIGSLITAIRYGEQSAPCHTDAECYAHCLKTGTPDTCEIVL